MERSETAETNARQPWTRNQLGNPDENVVGWDNTFSAKIVKQRAIARLAEIIIAGFLLTGCNCTFASPGLEIAKKYQVVFTAPPVKLPSDCSTDAPLLGNGDLMVALGGGPDLLQFYLGKADLWELRTQGGPRTMGRLDLNIPSLKGANYLVTQNLGSATTSGFFKSGSAILTMETAVAATANTMWVNLSAQGGTFAGEARLVLPGVPTVTVLGPITNGVPVQIGCEGYQNGRWYLNGSLDDLLVYRRALSAAEIGSIANHAPPPRDGLLREWKFDTLPVSDQLAGNAAYEAGPTGKALECNGQNTCIVSSPFPKLEAVTVSAFVKINAQSAPGNVGYILAQGEWNKNFSFGISAGGVRMAVRDDYAQSAPIPIGQWVHVAGTYDGRSIRVYVNGKEAAKNGVGDLEDGMQVIERHFEAGMVHPTGAASAMRILGAVDGSFTVAPGKPVQIVLTASGLANTPDYRGDALKRCGKATAVSLESLRRDHLRWWADFWSKSYIEIPDKILEQRYYLSNYCLGSASRLEHFPPGLFGWTTTDPSMWCGAYFMNYNCFAPFYGLYAGNHLEQSNPCNGPLLDFLGIGREWCRSQYHMDEGVLYPNAILPYGAYTGLATWQQQSNASYACVPIASTWYATYDPAFAQKAYPLVREVAAFWEHWLRFENGRYVDYHDAVCEEYTMPPAQSQDKNPIMTLALIRQVMDLAIDMSTCLGTDLDRRAKWADIRDHISDYPTCTVHDLPPGSRIEGPRTPDTESLPIFRYTESGRAWQNDNAVGIQHIFPGNGIGLDRRPDLLQRARNQITVMGRWIDLNGCNSFYPAAARVGYDPDIILKNLRHWVETATPNGMRAADNPHGTEQFSTVPCTLQEMLFQSYDGVLRFFPDWPRNQDARFGTLRARGAFLISAQLKAGAVSGVKIVSERGRDCVVANPWPGRAVTLRRDGMAGETSTGDRIKFKTRAGEQIELEPL